MLIPLTSYTPISIQIFLLCYCILFLSIISYKYCLRSRKLPVPTRFLVVVVVCNSTLQFNCFCILFLSMHQ